MSALPKPAAHELQIGQAFEGGFFAGLFTLEGKTAALIVSPKTGGEQKASVLAAETAAPGAVAYADGMANTALLAEGGSKLAKTIRATEINGLTDWYLPSADELELLYRAFKPTAQENWIYNRSGLNLSALPATRPYSKALPAQTTIEAFQLGGAEAFADGLYWSSTVLEDPSCAWYQLFGDGGQYYGNVGGELRARAVRRSFL